MLNGLG
jgi:hypothetical protein